MVVVFVVVHACVHVIFIPLIMVLAARFKFLAIIVTIFEHLAI